MKKVSLVRGVFAASLAVACMGALAGCSGSADADAASNVKLTGGVAATVNGIEIPEDKVTLAVESVRSDKALTDADEWGEWMSQAGYTPESVRSELLESYINQEVLRQSAAELDVSVDSATVDSYVESMKSNYDTEEKWQAALAQVGLTEDEYRDNTELSLIYQGVYATFATDEDPSAEEMLEYAQSHVSTYDGAKRSSHILFDAEDEATAKEVLAKINAGELDFATAAQEYSKDTGSAAQGGDVGWDKLTSFVTEYTNGLKDLEKDQVSGLVTSTYGIHIIKCTDVFNAPEELTSLDQIPAEISEKIMSGFEQNRQSQAYSDWLTSCREKADVVINDMPEGLSYNVDMSAYETDDASTDTDGTENAEGGADANASEGSSDAEAEGAGDAASESDSSSASSES